VSLRIAFDLDGTLANLDSALAEISRRLFGGDPEVVAPAEPAPEGETGAAEDRVTPPRVRSLTPRQQSMIWETARRTPDFWETLDETEPGVVARLAAVARARRWEVIFLTQRPPSDGGTTQRQSQRWLQAHGFDLPSVFVVTGSRGKVAAALDLDLVVDDRPENCLDVKVDSKARAALVVRGGGPAVPANAARLGIEATASVGELLDRLERGRDEGPSLLGRIKQVISGKS
jgi:phosphoserine phosphatase